MLSGQKALQTALYTLHFIHRTTMCALHIVQYTNFAQPTLICIHHSLYTPLCALKFDNQCRRARFEAKLGNFSRLKVFAEQWKTQCWAHCSAWLGHWEVAGCWARVTTLLGPGQDWIVSWATASPAEHELTSQRHILKLTV